jgi:hypothetical protein
MYLRCEPQRLPIEDEGTNEGAYEDAKDKIAVVVHRKKHDDVCEAELHHMETSADSLLQDAWSECLHGRSSPDWPISNADVLADAVSLNEPVGIGERGKALVASSSQSLANQVTIVLLG